MAKNKYIKWLGRQLPQWVEADLIHPSQAKAIEAYYPDSGRNFGRIFLSGIGAVVFGLGIILFFAYNWQEMHRFLKLGLILAAILSAHAGGQFFSRPGHDNPVAAESLALLGSVLFGAGIWLVSQIYHIDAHYPNAFLVWGAGALLMAWARQSLLQGGLALVLLGTWSGLEYFLFDQANVYAAWLILLGLAPLAWIRRSSLLLFITISLFYVVWMMSLVETLEENLVYLIFALSAVLVMTGSIIGRMPRIDFPHIRHVINVPGFIVYMAVVYLLTFSDFGHPSDLITTFENGRQLFVYWVSGLGVVVVSVVSLWSFPGVLKIETSDTVHVLFMMVSFLLLFLVGPGWWQCPYGTVAMLMNLVFVVHCLVFIVHGSNHQRGWEVAAGCVLLACLVFARYLDLFDSLLARSLVFLIFGGGLFGVGSFYARQKKEYRAASTLSTEVPS